MQHSKKNYQETKLDDQNQRGKKKDIRTDPQISSFYLFINYLFISIFGCVGSSLLRTGFL